MTSRQVNAAEALPGWGREIVDAYNAHACNQFILTGNVHDLFFGAPNAALQTLQELVVSAVVPRFEVVLACDIGHGLRVLRGAQVFGKWNEKPEANSKDPRSAIELITWYLRYVANLANIGQARVKVAVLLTDAHLFAGDRTHDGDTNALAFLIREWSRDPLLSGHDIVTFILSETLSELHPLLRQNPQAMHIAVSMPGAPEISRLLASSLTIYSNALGTLKDDLDYPSRQLAGGTLRSIVNLLKLNEHRGEALDPDDIAEAKAAFIELESPGLIEILPPKLSLDRLHGVEAVKEHLRQNIALWREQRLDLLPMGYLICGPVGTGKSFLVRCLAGEADVPVVVLKNFRDKWHGSTESNLEKIFRTIKAIGRCYVFIDEADQTLARRNSCASEPGVSGRIYSMLAQEMSNQENRGRIIWILATSRPDLVEVDLKRPGRVDIKIPLFPTGTAREGFALVQALASRHEIDLPDSHFEVFKGLIPDMMTPGEVEALVTELKREMVVTKRAAAELLEERLRNYSNPVPLEIIHEQIRLAVAECSRGDFIPDRFKRL